MKAHFKYLSVLMTFAAVLSAGADETFPTLQADGHIYKNVTVTTVTATDIYFSYDGGMGNVKLKDLSPDLQEHFHYNATAAAAQERQQAQANAQYFASQPPQWGTDFPAAMNRARSENKHILMDFTGSDWCPWCIKLDQEVFSSSQFAGFANENFVLVRVDFPHSTPQSEDLREANGALAARFNVNGYPTCILLDSSGRELGRRVGYMDGGLGAYMAWFESSTPRPVNQATPMPATDDTTTIMGKQIDAGATTTAKLAFVFAQLNAQMTPKFGPYWYVIACIPSSLILLTLIFRRIRKGSA